MLSKIKPLKLIRYLISLEVIGKDQMDSIFVFTLKSQMKLLIKQPTALWSCGLFVSVGSRGEERLLLCQSPYYKSQWCWVVCIQDAKVNVFERDSSVVYLVEDVIYMFIIDFRTKSDHIAVKWLSFDLIQCLEKTIFTR